MKMMMMNSYSHDMVMMVAIKTLGLIMMMLMMITDDDHNDDDG